MECMSEYRQGFWSLRQQKKGQLGRDGWGGVVIWVAGESGE